MEPQTLEKCVEIVEEQVQRLAALPDRVGALEGRVASLELTFLQHREEMRAAIFAVRTDMADGFAAVRGEMASLATVLRQEMREGDEQLRAEMRTGYNALLQQMRQFDDERRTQTLALHEDVIARISLLGEHLGGPKRKKPRTH